MCFADTGGCRQTHNSRMYLTATHQTHSTGRTCTCTDSLMQLCTHKNTELDKHVLNIAENKTKDLQNQQQLSLDVLIKAN